MSLKTILTLLLLAGPAITQAAGLHFEQIGTESGPPPGVVTAVYQDRAGFVWIGSRDGLFLYDGYSFVGFEHDAADPRSLSGNSIRVIYEDSRENLWVGTNTGGLNRLDRATWTFEQFRHDPENVLSLSHDSVYTILEDSGGTLWVGTQRGLNRLDRTDGSFQRFLADPSMPGSLHSDYVTSLYEDSRERVWVGTLGGGLGLWLPETGSFRVLRHDPDDPGTLSYDSVLTLLEDSSGDLWIGTNSGLNRMGRDGSIQRYEYDPVEPSGLADPTVTWLEEGPVGTLWIATYGGGLSRLDLASQTFHIERSVAGRLNSLSSDKITALETDHTGALWIATWGGGLNRLSASSMFFGSSIDASLPPEELTDLDTTALMHDSRGGLWIGVRSGDLIRWDVEQSSYRRYFRGGPAGRARIILALCEDRTGQVWVGTNRNLVRIDPKTGTEVSAPAAPEGPGPGFIKALLVDRKDRLWVGTGEGGLQRVDRDGRVLERFTPVANDPTSLSDDYVTALVEDGHGTIWVGTRSGGINAFDPETGRAERYVPDAATDNAIGHQYVTSILEDSKGRLWIGTSGGGLNLVRGRDATGRVEFSRFVAADGLIDNDVMALLEDDDGSLWLSTKRGLSRFDPGDQSFANFYLADGLPATEFEPRVASRDERTLYFGSIKWVVPVPAGTSFPPPASSPTLITSVRSAAGEIIGDRPVWQLERLEIPYGEWLSLEMAVLDYRTQQNHAYSYRLGDENEVWVDLGSRRAVTFTDLDPGTFAFSARGRNSQGVWSEAGPQLQIRVVPPFWMTLWFRGIVVLLVASAAIVTHLVRTSILEKRNRELMRLHEQREQARLELSLAYQRLRSLTRKLEMAKEDERRHIARELHDEMGPSLTAVIINMQLLADNPDAEQTARRIDDTIDLADRMIERIRDLSLDLRPPLIEELGLVSALKGYLEVQADRTGLAVEVEEDGDIEALSPEIQIVAFRIVQEAVTNVIRHAEASRAKVTVQHGDGKLQLIVKDDGRGFDVDDTMDHTSAGRALGLLGARERVMMLGGEFEIRSRPGHGTEVRAEIPAETEA
jgi:signal transduction histidine kinase/ligand-binding sensor domain-containing protein